MVAAMKIYELTATLAGTDKTGGTVRFKLADDQTVDTNNPITIPVGANYRRSFTKQMRLYCATAPDTQVDNLQLYSDGTNSFGTGVSVNASNVGVTWVANATPAFAGQDLFGYTSATPLDMDVTDSAVITATGFGGDIVKMQMVVASDASPGTLSAETVTFSYDEI